MKLTSQDQELEGGAGRNTQVKILCTPMEVRVPLRLELRKFMLLEISMSAIS